MKIKPLAIFFPGVIFILLLVFYGLNITEKGLYELMALDGQPEALHFEIKKNGLLITFAGKEYFLGL
jgi:hypothetical protein